MPHLTLRVKLAASITTEPLNTVTDSCALAKPLSKANARTSCMAIIQVDADAEFDDLQSASASTAVGY
jgi:hypothetical protein